MIKNRVYKLKEKATIQNGVTLPAGQELEIVMDVVYISGYPLPPNIQGLVLNWIKGNPHLLIDITKNW